MAQLRMGTPRQVVRLASAALLLGTLAFTIARLYHHTVDWRRGLTSWLPLSSPSTPATGASSMKPVGESYSETLVVACRQQDNMSWVESQIASLAVQNVTLYEMPESGAQKASAALSYLGYIVDAYEGNYLPDVSIFVQGRERAWYRPLLLDDGDSDSTANGLGGSLASILARLDRNFVLSQGFFNLRCDSEPGCPARLLLDAGSAGNGAIEEEARNMRTAWPLLFPDGRSMPPALAQPCCGEFAVTRERIQATPLEDWKRYRDWLVETDLSTWHAGRVWEYLWHFVFSSEGSDVATTGRLCPTVHSCYCQAYGVCFGDLDSWEAWDELRDQLDHLRSRHDRLLADGEEDDELKEGILQMERQVATELSYAKERGRDKSMRNEEPFAVE